MAYVNSHDEIKARMLASKKDNCFRPSKGETILELVESDFLDFDTVDELVQHPWLKYEIEQGTFYRFSKSKPEGFPYEIGCTYLMAEHDEGRAAFVKGYVAHYAKLDLPDHKEKAIPKDWPHPEGQKFKIGDKVLVRGDIHEVEYSYYQRYNATIGCSDYDKHLYSVKNLRNGNSWSWAEEEAMH